MARFLLTRLIQSVATLILLSLVIFVLARATGDPLTLILPMVATEEDFANARRYLGLDQPLPVQYLLFVGKAAAGDFGTSIRARRPVIELLRQRLPSSLALGAFSMAVSLLIAFPLGVLAAVRKGTALDTGAQIVAALGPALPTFWVGIVLVEIVVSRLQWLTAGGNDSPGHCILPGFTLLSFVIGWLMRILRASV